jgi:hypothetical protein
MSICKFYQFLHIIIKNNFYRLKDLLQPQYSQTEADLGAGKSAEILPPAHPILSERMVEA